MTNKNRLCDDCMTVAYDHGFDDPDQQIVVMVITGQDTEEHNCSMREEPEYFIGKCICGCNNE